VRIVNRLLALILSLAIIAVGVILIIEVIASRSGAQPVVIGWHSILQWGQRNTWKATSVELACAILVVVGLLLLLPQLRRRRPTRVTVDSGDQATDAAITRKGIVTTVRGAVGDVEGISGSRVKVGHRRIQVNATGYAATDEAVSSDTAVKEAAQQAVDELKLSPSRQLRVKVAAGKKGDK
jgi:hypothetical protein